MKYIAHIMAFYLLLGSLIPRTDLSQLMKLSDLAEHYQLHVQEANLAEKDFSLTSFVWEHFIQPESHNDTHGDNQHQDLPFHSFQAPVLAAQSGHVYLVSLLPGQASKAVGAYQNDFHLTGCFPAIDHPPAS